jgi:hypothetical protein
MFTKAFWRISLEYALKASAQTLVAISVVRDVLELDLSWHDILVIVIIVMLLSFLTSIATAKIKNGYHE